MAKRKWIRFKDQEDGHQVYRWFETRGGFVASVVEGYFPNEANIRISSPKMDSIEIRGHKSIILNQSDDELIRKIDMHIDRKLKYG